MYILASNLFLLYIFVHVFSSEETIFCFSWGWKNVNNIDLTVSEQDKNHIKVVSPVHCWLTAAAEHYLASRHTKWPNQICVNEQHKIKITWDFGDGTDDDAIRHCPSAEFEGAFPGNGIPCTLQRKPGIDFFKKWSFSLDISEVPLSEESSQIKLTSSISEIKRPDFGEMIDEIVLP